MAEAGKYALAGVMGWPVSHSRSPLLHDYWLAKYNLPGAYVLLPVRPERLGTALRALPALGFAGCNLTLPHKIEALRIVDRVDAVARRIGAINTIVVEPNGTLSGYNYDGVGYLRSLRDAHPDWRADAGPVMVLGGGGAACAVVAGLVDAGACEVRICNRTAAHAETMAQAIGGPISVVPWGLRADTLGDVALLINATSQGMTGQAPGSRARRVATRRAGVGHRLHAAGNTAARRRAGPREPNAGGLGMLLNQARPAFHAWFGVMPEITPELSRRVEATL